MRKLSIEESLLKESQDNQRSGNEIHYEIPKNWAWLKSTDVLDIQYGKGLPISNLTSEGYPVYGANGKIGYYNEYTQEKPQVLMTCRGATCGTINVSEPKSFITSNSLILKPKWNADIKFMEYLFKFLDKRELISGSAQPQITVKKFNNFYLPLPPLAEQKRIAKRVEKLFQKLDEAGRLIREAHDNFESRQLAILTKGLKGELTTNWRKLDGNYPDSNTIYNEMKNYLLKEYNIPLNNKKVKPIDNNEIETMIPTSWKWVRLGDVFKITSGGTPKRSKAEYYNGEIPWIKTGEIKWNYIQNGEEFITQTGLENSSAKLLPRNTVLVAMYGQGLTRGRAGILKIKASCNQAVCAILPNSYVLPEFLFYYFMEGYHRFRNSAKGGNQENLSGSMISNFIFPLPPLNEQKEIVRLLNGILSKEKNVNQNLKLLLSMDKIKKSILNKAFRGELGTNDPTEESAIKLLKDFLNSK